MMFVREKSINKSLSPKLAGILLPHENKWYNEMIQWNDTMKLYNEIEINYSAATFFSKSDKYHMLLSW